MSISHWGVFPGFILIAYDGDAPGDYLVQGYWSNGAIWKLMAWDYFIDICGSRGL